MNFVQKNPGETKREAGLNITEECRTFLEKHKGNTSIDESEIMELLGRIGELNYDNHSIEIDPAVREQLLQLLEQNGYTAKSPEDQYKIGSSSQGKNTYVVGGVFIVCDNGEDLTQYNSSEFARFAIENAMAQISSGKLYYANTDMAYMYERMRENEKVIEVLSHSMASDLHEAWRSTRKREDGTYEPRMKKSKDQKWNEEHGTDDVDIANLSFEELPSNWQYENLEAARVAISQVYHEIESNQIIFNTKEKIEAMSAKVHEAWLSRNDWVYDPENGDPALAKPYEELSEEEKAKDRVQIEQAIAKVKEYLNRRIDIDETARRFGLAERFGISPRSVINPELTPEQVAEISDEVSKFENETVRDGTRQPEEESHDQNI